MKTQATRVSFRESEPICNYSTNELHSTIKRVLEDVFGRKVLLSQLNHSLAVSMDNVYEEINLLPFDLYSDNTDKDVNKVITEILVDKFCRRFTHQAFVNIDKGCD